MKAVYEIVVGEGVGKGRGGEILLPLGDDMVSRVEGARKFLGMLRGVLGLMGDAV